MAKTIRVIDEIAFQTNLLALNAAVEAAGGEFEEVDNQVRGLAQRNSEAETALAEAGRDGRQDAYSAEELNAQSADLRNIAVRLAALAGGDEAKSAQHVAGPLVRAPAKGSGF